MKKLLSALLVFLLVCFFSACEKDDICVDGDTPLLVIGFFDIEDTTAPKEVPSLRIRAIGQVNPINSEDTFVDRTSNDSIGIPLRIDNTTTSFEFISDSADEDDVETGTIDTLTFLYQIVERFNSRGCGIVANYSELDTMRNVFESDWIKRVQVVDTAVENSSNIHVKIFH